MHYLLLIILILIFSGCVTPKHQVVFKNVYPAQSNMKHVIDNRPEKELDGGRAGLAEFINRMPDRDFLPIPVQLLNARVTYKMGLLGRNESIELDHFDVLDVYAYSGSQRQPKLNNTQKKKKSWVVTGLNGPDIKLQDDAKRADFVQCHISGRVLNKNFSVYAHERYIRSSTGQYDIEKSKPFIDVARKVTELCVDKAVKEIGVVFSGQG